MFDFNTQSALIIVGGYLLGSVSTALILTKLYKTDDPREHHSGNPGTTNMMRVAGTKVGLMTFAGDCLKSIIWLKLALHLGASRELLEWASLALVCGHCFPVFHKFQGGKGAATGLGAYTALFWPVGLLSLVTFIFVTSLTGVVAIASIVTTLCTLGYYTQHTGVLSLPLALFSVVIIARHHSNIRKLYSEWRGNDA